MGNLTEIVQFNMTLSRTQFPLIYLVYLSRSSSSWFSTSVVGNNMSKYSDAATTLPRLKTRCFIAQVVLSSFRYQQLKTNKLFLTKYLFLVLVYFVCNYNSADLIWNLQNLIVRWDSTNSEYFTTFSHSMN